MNAETSHLIVRFNCPRETPPRRHPTVQYHPVTFGHIAHVSSLTVTVTFIEGRREMLPE